MVQLYLRALNLHSFGRHSLETGFRHRHHPGDTGGHYGLEARHAFIQMITNHLASRQGLEF
jgi:hypothetical protein